jgi:hypothetical protein
MNNKEGFPRRIANFTKLNIERVRRLFDKLPNMSTPGEGELRNQAMPDKDYIKRYGKAPDFVPEDWTKEK